jgi:hypothetical protein
MRTDSQKRNKTRDFYTGYNSTVMDVGTDDASNYER